MAGEPMTDALSHNFAVDASPVGWQPSTSLTFDEWEAVGNTLLAIDRAVNFWIGDWICYGENKWGEMYAQAEAITGWRYDRLARAKWVSSRVPFLARRPNLSWTAHLAVAPLPANEQGEWLDVAEEQGLSSSELKQAIKAASLPRIAPPTPLKSAHDESDDVPFSASAPGVWADADEAVEEYEERRVKRTIELESDEYEEAWIARSWNKDRWLSGAVCDTPGEAVNSLLEKHYGVVVKEQELPY